MSNIDKRALREAAEKATPGVWVYLPKNTSIEYDYGSDDSQGSVTYMDSGDFTQNQTDLNGAFIAAANPATVLALLDELEAKEEQRANWFQMAEKLGADLDAVEKRIAELEVRDKPKFVQCWSCKHDIEVLPIADCDGYCPRCAAPIDLDDEPYAAAGKGETS